jgi:hypothetical protein
MSESRNKTLADVFQRALDSFSSRIRVGMPGRIESYDAATQRASVAPMVDDVQVDEDTAERTVTSFPVVNGVRVIFPGSGKFRVTFPVKAGDLVWLSFGDRSLAEFLSGDGTRSTTPLDPRQHDGSDAVAFPGFATFGAPLAAPPDDALTIGLDGGIQISIGTTDIRLAGGSTPVAKEGSATAGHTHTGTAGPYPVVLAPATDAIAAGAGSPNVKVP